MGDKRRKKRKAAGKNNPFNFAPSKHPQEIIDHLADLLNQHRSTTSRGGMPDQPDRGVLRSALHNRDSSKIRCLIRDGIDVNTVIDDVFRDTPLTYAIKCGFLEIVEILVKSPDCRLQSRLSDKHSVLDEAIRAWLMAALPSSGSPQGTGNGSSQQQVGRRYRILRCLLEGGATDLHAGLLDVLLFSRLNDKCGLALVAKLVQAFCDRGSRGARSNILGAVISYKHTCPLVNKLLLSGACPDLIPVIRPAHAFLPLDNAILLVQATNRRAVLDKVERDTAGPQHQTGHVGQTKRWELLRLLTLSGHVIRLSTMAYLYRNHATTYKWLTAYNTQPRRLSHLARVTVRKQMHPNVLEATQRTNALPDSVKHFLLLET